MRGWIHGLVLESITSTSWLNTDFGPPHVIEFHVMAIDVEPSVSEPSVVQMFEKFSSLSIERVSFMSLENQDPYNVSLHA